MSVEDELTEEETSEEVVDEDVDLEDDDILAAEVEVPQGGGCSAGTWVIILLIVAALVYVGVWQVKKNASERAERDRTNRSEIRSTMLHEIAGDLNTVDTRLQQGDIAGAIDSLNQMDYKLGAVQTEASRATDLDAAAGIGEMRQSIATATKDIQAEYEALQASAQGHVGEIRSAMGIPNPVIPVDEGADVPAVDEPVGEPPVAPAGEELPAVEEPIDPVAPEGDPVAEPVVDEPAAEEVPPPAPPGGPETDPLMPPAG